jgi:hypothetical protein
MAVLNGMPPVGRRNFILPSGVFKAWLWLAGAADGLNFLRQASENM